MLRAADALLGLEAPKATGTLRGAASGDGAPIGPRCVLEGGTKELNAAFLEIFLLGVKKPPPQPDLRGANFLEMEKWGKPLPVFGHLFQ